MGVFVRVALVVLVAHTLFLLPGSAADKKKKQKKKKKQTTVTFESKLRKLVKTDAQADVLKEVCEALRPRDGEAWSLQEQGTKELEPYAVGTTALVDALELRTEEPSSWSDVASWSDAALAGDLQAHSALETQLERWASAGRMLATAKSNELSNCAQGLSWFTGRALDAVKCLGLSRCNKARAWEAGRHLHDAAYNNAAGSKWGRLLEAHDLEWALAPTFLDLALRLAKIYDVDLRERPENFDQLKKTDEHAKRDGNDGDADSDSDDGSVDEVYVDAGALDKQWNALTDAERGAARMLGYTEESFAETAPPLAVKWSSLGKKEQKLATYLGWDSELWDTELEAAAKEL